MPIGNRGVLHAAIHVATALALVVAVMTSPIRPARSAAGPCCLRRNFSLPPVRSVQKAASPAASAATRVKALRTEGEEEELAWAARPAHIPTDPTPAPHRDPARDLTPTAHVRAPHPLRC